mgnify:CR=1 FL=1
MALVAGCVTRQQKLKGYLYKDEKTNKVGVHETLEEFPEHLKKDALAIETVYEPVAATKQATLLKGAFSDRTFSSDSCTFVKYKSSNHWRFKIW